MSLCFLLAFSFLFPATSQIPGTTKPVTQIPGRIPKPLRPSKVPALLRYSRLSQVPLVKRIDLLKKAVSSSQTPGFPKSLRLLMRTQLGMLLLAARRPKMALETFERVLKNLPPSQVDLLGQSLLGKGQALVALGHRKEALQSLHTVIHRCAGTIYAKQAQKTLLIVKNLKNPTSSRFSPIIPIQFLDLQGRPTHSKKARMILLIRADPLAFFSSSAGKLLAKRITDPSLLALVFATPPNRLGSQIKAQIRGFEEQTELKVYLTSPKIQKALKKLFLLQPPKSILLSLKGRILDINPSPGRCASFLALSKKGN